MINTNNQKAIRKSEDVLEKETYLRSRHKDVKKWYNDNPELQNKCGYFEWFILDMVSFRYFGKNWKIGNIGKRWKWSIRNSWLLNQNPKFQQPKSAVGRMHRRN